MKVNDMIHAVRKTFAVVLAVGLIVPACPLVGFAGAYDEAQILKGDVFTVAVKNLQRVSVTEPSIADISDATADEVSVIGKKAGQTTLFVWDETGKKTVTIRVFDEDLLQLKARVKMLLQSAGVTGVDVQENAYEGKIVLSGNLSDDKKKVVEQAIAPFANKVINLVQKEAIDDLIQIDMQVTELSTTLTKKLGVEWSQSVDYEETLPNALGKSRDLFKIGDFNRTTGLVATVNAMIADGEARILSKPRLVVVNGKEATLLVGGEIPIRTETVSSTGTTEDVEYKEYGVNLAMTPTIRNGKVDILMNVEISEVDSTQSTEKDVAFTTRSAQTQLFLNDRQTIVLAGMIKKRDNKEVKRVPFLGSIPVVGLLFRSTSTPVANEDTEIVISLTPTILRSIAAQVMPTQTARVYSQNVEMPSVAVEELSSVEGLPMEDGRNNVALPVITKNAGTVPVSVSGDFQTYALAIQEKLSSAIAYPYAARENGWQGTVKLGMIVRRDGSLRDVFVKESSGYDIFDQDAVNTALLLAPYASFPNNFQEEQVTITIPIVYSLDSFLKNVAKRN